MKKKNFIYGLLALLIALMYACSYEDKSLYIKDELPNIIIDTSGVSKYGSQLLLYRDSILSIHPQIVYEGGTDDDFEYEWRLGLKLNSYAGTIGDYIVISKEKDLDWKVDIYETPAYQYYPLWFRVKHKETGVVASVRWSLEVKTEFRRGLLVIDTDDDKTCDFTVVQDSIFDFFLLAMFSDNGVGGATTYERDIYSREHGAKFDGVIKDIFHQKLYRGSALEHYMHGFADNGRIFRMNTSSFDIIAEGKDLFYDPDIELKPERYRDLGTWNSIYAVLVNDGKLYRRMPEDVGAVDIRKFGNPQKQICRVPSQVCGVDNLAFFSEDDGKFYYTSLRWFEEEELPETFETVDGALFDPNDMKGYKNVIAREYVGTGEYRFILEKDGKYVFCTLGKWGTPERFLDLSGLPEVNNAISFCLPSDNNKFIFYATRDKVYVIDYTSDLRCEVFYAAPEPIQSISIFNDNSSLDSGGGIQPSYKSSSILVNTYDGKEGRLYWMYCNYQGKIDEYTGVHVYDGFKKVTAVATIY